MSTPDDTLDTVMRMENLRAICDQLYYVLAEKNKIIAQLQQEIERLRKE